MSAAVSIHLHVNTHVHSSKDLSGSRGFDRALGEQTIGPERARNAVCANPPGGDCFLECLSYPVLAAQGAQQLCSELTSEPSSFNAAATTKLPVGSLVMTVVNCVRTPQCTSRPHGTHSKQRRQRRQSFSARTARS